jgi:glyceraldehyde 3-phosphate dehydrogenase
VPTPNVSVVDLKFIAKRDTSAEEINKPSAPLLNVL